MLMLDQADPSSWRIFIYVSSTVRHLVLGFIIPLTEDFDFQKLIIYYRLVAVWDL